MRFDDRAANRKAHPGAAGFRREERLEDALRVVRTDADSGILNRHQHAVGLDRLRFHRQHPRAIRQRGHGLDGIHDQVQKNLLQLNAVDRDEWQALTQFDPQRYAVALQIAPLKRENVVDQSVDVERDTLPSILAEDRTGTLDDVAGVEAHADDLR